MKLKANCKGCGGKCKDRRAHAIRGNLSKSEIRYENLNNKRYMVIPVVMARAGIVMNGSLTVAEELVAEGWNGRPVTVGHPEKEGNFESANTPHTLTEWCVGQLFNAKVDGDALKSEAWIDVELANKVDPTLIAALKGSKPMDVSTGFFSDDEPSTGESKGRAYEVISRNWIPDHLALLPGDVGACSWADGCGVRSNRRAQMKKTRRNGDPDQPRADDGAGGGGGGGGDDDGGGDEDFGGPSGGRDPDGRDTGVQTTEYSNPGAIEEANTYVKGQFEKKFPGKSVSVKMEDDFHIVNVDGKEYYFDTLGEDTEYNFLPMNGPRDIDDIDEADIVQFHYEGFGPDDNSRRNKRKGVKPKKSNRRLLMKLKNRTNRAVGGILTALGLRANDAKARSKVSKVLNEIVLNERGDDEDARQIVADLISNDASPFIPDDEESLRMMSADTLKKMRKQYLTAADEAPADEDEEVVAAEDEELEEEVVVAEGEEDEELVAAEGEEADEEEPKAAKRKRNKLDATIAKHVAAALARALPASDRAALKVAKDMAAKKRDSLTRRILANSKMTKKQLAGMTTETLEVIANGLGEEASFEGQPLPRFNGEDEGFKDMLPPSTRDLILNRRAN